jgi:hypothetical protein
VNLLINQEVADEMRCCVDTMLARSRRVKVLPTFAGHSGHRWSREDADELIKRWSTYSQKHGLNKSKGGTGKSLPSKTQATRRARDGAGNRR